MQGLKLISAALCAALLLSGCMDLESRRMRIEQGTDVFTGGASRFERMKAIADKGDPTAQFKVAEGYYLGAFNGQSVEKNLEMAKRYYTMAANNPHDSRWQMRGLRQYARERLDEIAKDQDPVYQRRLAQQRRETADLALDLSTIAQPDLTPQQRQQYSESYQRGDYAAALHLLRPLAERGNREAQNNLALMYLVGQGVARDPRQAAEWYRKSALQGYSHAQNSFANMYDEGVGVKQDSRQAAYWYRKAAQQGHASAQNNLGVMYTTGQGVPKNYREATNWLRKSARQGYAEAQYNLGIMYKQGLGVTRDLRQAETWLRKAAEQGNAGAIRSLQSLQ